MPVMRQRCILLVHAGEGEGEGVEGILHDPSTTHLKNSDQQPVSVVMSGSGGSGRLVLRGLSGELPAEGSGPGFYRRCRRAVRPGGSGERWWRLLARLNIRRRQAKTLPTPRPLS
ncbi:hypothetical protein E2C01_050618 [Portunus trituberculatus]|uniref:Uncharacterized protein n=1 Tax=Portunus trituberculatus TaxID=210409 RepID=A0A5B7GGZ9_PORTR|nr:hypothetical protein [Portunus trituberculatus]